MIQSPAGYQGDVRIKRYLDFYQAGYGVAMLSSGTTAFTPASLFAASEPGGWYDPSDLTTLYQDAAGTTPVTAVEQPVGRVLDKSGRGNHLSQSTAAARPVLSARVNLLTYTEQFDNAAWTKGNVTVSANAATAPDGTATADSLTPTAGSLTNSGTNVFSVSVKSADQRYMQISRSGNASDYVNFDLQGVTASSYGSAIGSITASGDGWYRLTVTFPSLNNTTMFVGYADSLTFARQDVTASTNVVYIWGADLRPANAGVGLPAYQRVGAATDYDTTGFPLYLKFDGTDDFLQSSAIDPGSVDKAQVFSGIRKITDPTGYTNICETSVNSASTAGTFGLFGTANGLPRYGVGLTGSSGIGYDPQTYAAPITNVLTAMFDIGAAGISTENIPRINGVVNQTNPAGTTAGTGNFSSQPFYIGARFGTSSRSNFFNGHLYSLILRFSAANLDAATITATETWVNQRTKAF
jgi:hypothetical protein